MKGGSRLDGPLTRSADEVEGSARDGDASAARGWRIVGSVAGRFGHLGAAALYVPITMIADHYGYVTRSGRLLVLAGLVMGSAWLLASVLDRVGLSRPVSTSVGMVAVLVVVFGGTVAGGVPGGYPLTAALGVATGLLLIRLQARKWPRLLLTWLAVTLWLFSASSVVGAVWSHEPSLIRDRSPSVPILDSFHRDVVLVVFDELPSLPVASTALAVATEDVVAQLESEEFEVFEEMLVDYAFTELSLPAFFGFGIPSGAGDLTTESTRRDFVRIVGGDSPLVRAFSDAGYRITVVESGWSGLRCTEIVDVCVGRSWYDEVTGAALVDSILRPMVQNRLGEPFTHGVERNLEWIRTELPALADNGHPDFVFIHLLLPHHPIAFDAECRSGPPAPRSNLTAQAEQVRCANQTMLEVARVTRGSVTVLMGDHGSNLQGQLDLAPHDWTPEMVRERMHTSVAVRGLQDCDEERADTLTNVGVWLVRCFGGDVPYVDSGAFITSVRGEPLVRVDPATGELK